MREEEEEETGMRNTCDELRGKESEIRKREWFAKRVLERRHRKCEWETKCEEGKRKEVF